MSTRFVSNSMRAQVAYVCSSVYKHGEEESVFEIKVEKNVGYNLYTKQKYFVYFTTHFELYKEFQCVDLNCRSDFFLKSL